MFKLKKYTVCIFLLSFLLVSLYITINYEDESIKVLKSFKNIVYAEEQDKSTNHQDKQTDKSNGEQDKDKTKDTNNANQSSTSTEKPSGNDMVELLARLINGEARGEPYQGQVAVGAVILNRVKSPQFPNTIASVIYQNSQFSCIKDGQFDQPIEKDSTVYKAAQEAMNGSDPSNGALYFYNPKKTSNKYLYSLKKTTTIGDHVFALGEE